MKRFYKTAGFECYGEQFAIVLDGKIIKTPGKLELNTSYENLAELVSQEWDNQKAEINPDEMPITQLLNTKLDKISNQREEMEEHIFRYFHTDLICYFANDPPELLKLQKAAWSPWLDWAETKYGISMITTFGLSAVQQSPELGKKIRHEISSMDDDRFTILQAVVGGSGSLILGLAFLEKAISPNQIMTCSFVEEDFKAEIYDEDLYGPDPLIAKKKKSLKRDLEGALKYLSCL